MNAKGGATSFLIVPADDLRQVLMPIFERRRHLYEEARLSARGRSDRPVIGATDAIASETGVPHRRLYEILFTDKAFVTLDVADRLLTRLGLPHMLWDGSVRVLPNPQLSEKRLHERAQAAGVNLKATVVTELRETA